MNPFTLGRMRWFDLLALYYRLNPDGHEHDPVWMASITPGYLAAAMLDARTPRT